VDTTFRKNIMLNFLESITFMRLIQGDGDEENADDGDGKPARRRG
jgi:hypothetical protein